MTTTPVHNITDDQIAEIEVQARERIDNENQEKEKLRKAGSRDEVVCTITLFPREVLALITRLREAEKDAARYRFLKASCYHRADVEYGEVSIVVEGVEFADMSDFDRLIDTAMQEHTK